MAQARKYPSMLLKREGLCAGVGIEFTIPCKLPIWEDFVSQIGLSLQRDGDAKTWISRFVALPKIPKEAEVLSLYLAGDVHSHKDDTVHWRLNWRLIPNQPPTHEIMKNSASVGGYEQFTYTLAKHWPGEKSIEAWINASYYLFNRGWQSSVYTVSPKRKKINTENETIKISTESVKFSLEPASGIISKVTQTHHNIDVFEMEASGKGLIIISDDLLSNEEQVWHGLKPLLKEKQKSSTAGN